MKPSDISDYNETKQTLINRLKELISRLEKGEEMCPRCMESLSNSLSSEIPDMEREQLSDYAQFYECGNCGHKF